MGNPGLLCTVGVNVKGIPVMESNTAVGCRDGAVIRRLVRFAEDAGLIPSTYKAVQNYV